MNSSLRVVLFALLLSRARVLGRRPGAVGRPSVAAVQAIASGRPESSRVVGNLSAGKVSRSTGRPAGRSQRGRGGRAEREPRQRRATLPAAELPRDFKRDAAAPPVLNASAPEGDTGVWGRIQDWFSSPVRSTRDAVDNPSFSREVTCDGSPGCVQVMTLKENSPQGLKSVPITTFVDYGAVKHNGKADTQIWDSRRVEVLGGPAAGEHDDVRQGGLGIASCWRRWPRSPQGASSPPRDDKQQKGTLAVWVQFFDGRPPSRSWSVRSTKIFRSTRKG